MGNTVTLYHGSNQLIEFPRFAVSRKIRDFSWGFYCTVSKENARKKAARYGKKGVINEYVYTPDKDLKILRFNAPDEEWARFIAQCSLDLPISWDMVIGPEPEGHLRGIALRLAEGRMSLQSFNDYVDYLPSPVMQFNFRTPSSFQALRFVQGENIHGKPVLSKFADQV